MNLFKGIMMARLHSMGTISLTLLGVAIGYDYIIRGQQLFGLFLVLGQLLPCIKVLDISNHDSFENAVHVIAHNSHE